MNGKLESEVLKLNQNWVPIEIISARKAYEDGCAGAVTFLRFEDGYPIPHTIEEWMDFEARAGEDFVTTSRMHGLKRVPIPRVVICVHFNRIITKTQPCTPENLMRRYNGRCAVTRKKLRKKDFSREHVVPKSKGGGKGWDNIVPMHRGPNSRRGNGTYEAVGLKPPKILPAPRPLLPINSMVNKNGWPEWDLFHIPRA